MPRPRTAEARALLQEVAKAHGYTAPVLLFRLRFRRVINAKREFIALATSRGIPAMTIAGLLKLHHTTVLYHASPAMQERKNGTRTRGEVVNRPPPPGS